MNWFLFKFIDFIIYVLWWIMKYTNGNITWSSLLTFLKSTYNVFFFFFLVSLTYLYTLPPLGKLVWKYSITRYVMGILEHMCSIQFINGSSWFPVQLREGMHAAEIFEVQNSLDSVSILYNHAVISISTNV